MRIEDFTRQLDSLGDDPFRSLLTHWLSIRNGRPLPRKADLSPVRMRSIVPHLTLYEWIRPDKIIMRVSGATFFERFDERTSGWNLLEFVPEDSARIFLDAMEGADKSPTATFMKIENVFETGMSFFPTVLNMPLTDDTDKITHVISVTRPHATQADLLRHGTIVKPMNSIPELITINLTAPTPE